MLLYMQHRIQLAFCTASLHCWVMMSFSSTNILKSFFSGLFSIHSPLSLYCPDPLPPTHPTLFSICQAGPGVLHPVVVPTIQERYNMEMVQRRAMKMIKRAGELAL